MNADAVVFVHSTGTGPLLFRGVPAAALGGRPAIHHANVGYPPEPLVPRGTEVSVADDVARLVAAAPDGPVHLVAHSYGGLVAMLAADVLGPKVASMFLYEPVLFRGLERLADPAVAAELRTFSEQPWFLEDEARGGDRAWLELFVDYWNRPGTWASFPPPMQDALLALGWKMFMEVRSTFAQDKSVFDWTFSARTTLAYGERSPAASRATARALAEGRDAVRLVALPELGHMAPLTHPAPVHAAIAQHFRG